VDIHVSPAPVSNNHLPFIPGLELILVKGWASNLRTTSFISIMYLHASLIQVCLIMLMMEGSAKLFSSGFEIIVGLLILIV
jgi:hypothetical protein